MSDWIKLPGLPRYGFGPLPYLLGFIGGFAGGLTVADLVNLHRWPVAFSLPVFIVSCLISFVCFGILGVYLEFWLAKRFGWLVPMEPGVDELAATLKALENNSQAFVRLFTDLQTKMRKRQDDLRETESALAALRAHRSLLELTPAQQNALRALVQEPQAIRGMFTSRFWLGNVAVNALFFFLGLFADRMKEWWFGP